MSQDFVVVDDKKIVVQDNFLNLRGLRIENIEDIKGLESLKDLEVLDLSNNEIIKIDGLSNLKKLKQLNLSFNRISEIENLENLINLKALLLNSNRITEIKGLSNLSVLEILFLSGNRILKIEGLDGLINLKILILPENGISEIENLEDQENLEELNLVHNQIVDLTNIKHLKNLKKLELSENKIDDITQLEELKNLRILTLSHNNIKRIDIVFNLLKLDILSLRFNPIENKYHKYLTERTINFQEYRFFHKSQIYKFLEFDDHLTYEQEIERLTKEIEDIDDIELYTDFGTHRENPELKEKHNFVFFNRKPEIVPLNNKDKDIEGILIHLIQTHSLKGIKPVKKDKIGHFLYFIKNFWDPEIIEQENVLVYKERKYRAAHKIKELVELSLKLYANSSYDVKPKLVIFPENSIPFRLLPCLIEYSKNNNIILIGGLEHQKDTNNKYINKAFILENGKIMYQEKQTPVRIYHRQTKSFIEENIHCAKIPSIKIFQTSIGKIAIFICKDFLRLNDVLVYWAATNQVDFVIIPSFTNEILPFQSKILKMLESPDCKDLKIIYTSMGEYGGSELFSVNDKRRIENNFRLNERDNVGEVIVSRRCLLKEVSDNFSSIMNVNEFLDYILTKQPHVVNFQGIDALTTATGADFLERGNETLRNLGYYHGVEPDDFEDYESE